MKTNDFVSATKKRVPVVKKTVECWVNVYADQKTIWDSKEDADFRASRNRIACVHITGSYEVEGE